jgi:hypothetical protein
MESQCHEKTAQTQAKSYVFKGRQRKKTLTLMVAAGGNNPESRDFFSGCAPCPADAD